jgi:hypothetical protein
MTESIMVDSDGRPQKRKEISEGDKMMFDVLMMNDNYKDCLLSILDTLKLHDTGSLIEDDETLSEMMFRKMKAYNIDLNKELGFTHLKPITKKK